MEEYVIQHHGIKGQRWGVRRFQNEDGTLTEAGKKHKAKEYQKQLNFLEGTQANRSAKAASYVRSNYLISEALAKMDSGNKKVDSLLSRKDFSTKRLDELEAEYNVTRQQMADLLNKIERDPDLVWGVTGTRYGTTYHEGKDSKDGTYYNFVTGSKFKVKSSSKERNKKIAKDQHFREHIPIREEYYYY